MVVLMDKIRDRMPGIKISYYNSSLVQKGNPNDSEIQAFLNDPNSVMNNVDFLATSA
jgi:hypothetical protein